MQPYSMPYHRVHVIQHLIFKPRIQPGLVLTKLKAAPNPAMSFRIVYMHTPLSYIYACWRWVNLCLSTGIWMLFQALVVVFDSLAGGTWALAMCSSGGSSWIYLIQNLQPTPWRAQSLEAVGKCGMTTYRAKRYWDVEVMSGMEAYV